MEAEQHRIDEALLGFLGSEIPDPTCGWDEDDGCLRLAESMAFCRHCTAHVIDYCTAHRQTLQLLYQTVRCRECGRSGSPRHILDWRPIFTERSRA